MSHRDFSVRVLAPGATHNIDPIPDYESVSVTWQRLGVGTATIVMPERGRAAAQLMAGHTHMVPVIIEPVGHHDHRLPRWMGRVAAFSAVKDSKRIGQVQATLVSEWKMLQKIIAPPVPASPWSNQTAAEHDVRTGPIVTITKAYIQANINRLAAEGRPTPLVIAPTVGADTSPTVTLKARNQPLHELLLPELKVHGYDIQVALWLPGDRQPTGLTLTAPRLVVSVLSGRNQPYVRFTDTVGGVQSRMITGSHPQAMGVVVGGPGEKVARIFQKEMATDTRVADLGIWGYPEEWLDATDADTAEIRTQRAQERLLELSGTAAVSVTINDGQPWFAGPQADYWINDMVRAEFNGVAVSDRIDRVTATDNNEGFRVSSIFGSARDTETADALLTRTIIELRRKIATLEAGR